MRFLSGRSSKHIGGIGGGGGGGGSGGGGGGFGIAFAFGHGRLLGKSFRWLRWSTICAILFYMFFIGLILHSTSYKLQHSTHKSTSSTSSSISSSSSSSSSSASASLSSLSSSAVLQQHNRNRKHNTNFNFNRNPNRNRNHNNEINAHTRNIVDLPLPQQQKHHQQEQLEQLEQQQQQQQQSSSVPSNSNVLQMPASQSSEATVQTSFHSSSNIGAAVPAPSPASSLSSSASSSATSMQYKNGNDGVDVSVGVGLNGLMNDGKMKGKRNEPETVILAASSVNEKQILEKTFRRADKNLDGRLSIQELAFYINRKIQEHIDDAIQQNPREFRRVDIAPADGLISWEEYHNYFLREHALTDADLDEHGEIRSTPLNRHIREELLRDKARWTEVARTDVFSLTIDEFLAFRHPESSVTNLLELVDDLLRQFDQDGDDQLSLEEFSDVTMNDDEDLIRKSLISRTVVERRAEFKRILDRNHDGKADREELLHYVDPKTPRYALQESATLFALADENHDNWLTLDELVANAEIFLTSKMFDTANSFHTEF